MPGCKVSHTEEFEVQSDLEVTSAGDEVCKGGTMTFYSAPTGGTWSCAAGATINSSGVLTGGSVLSPYTTSMPVHVKYTNIDGCRGHKLITLKVDNSTTPDVNTVVTYNTRYVLYPNPSDGAITISLNGQAPPTDAKIIKASVQLFTLAPCSSPMARLIFLSLMQLQAFTW